MPTSGSEGYNVSSLKFGGNLFTIFLSNSFSLKIERGKQICFQIVIKLERVYKAFGTSLAGCYQLPQVILNI